MLIIELAELRADGERARAFLDVANDLCIDVERTADGDDLLGHFGAYVDFHAMAHVEHLIHLAPVGAGTIVDGSEEWGYGEHVVLHHAAVVGYEMEHLRLSASRAMHHTVNLGAKLVEQALDDGSIGAGRRENELAHIGEGEGLRLGRNKLDGVGGGMRDGFRCGIRDVVGEAILAAIDEVVGHGVVEALGILLGQILGEDIVAGRGEAIGAHASVVAMLVGVSIIFFFITCKTIFNISTIRFLIISLVSKSKSILAFSKSIFKPEVSTSVINPDSFLIK